MNWRGDLQVNTGKTSVFHAVTSYFISPSFKSVTRYRIYSWLYRQGLLGKLLHKPLWQRNCLMGCYVSPRAFVGPRLHFPHPTGVVIGDGARIGSNVTIYQGVTVGVARKGENDYPVIRDDVTIFANACVFGAVTIGEGAIIAAHSVVTKDVPPGTTVAGIPARVVRPNRNFEATFHR